MRKWRDLPFLRPLFEMRRDLWLLRSAAEIHARASQELLITQILSAPKYSDPKRLNRYEAQVFSQNGEDGIISEIFARIGVTNRVFVEFGAGDGIQNNCAYLLLKGWAGYWFDASDHNIGCMKAYYQSHIKDNCLVAAKEFFTAETAEEILRKHKVPETFDILSLDIDRNTSWIWKALQSFRPRVAVIEYNGSIPPQDEWEIPYDAQAVWDGSVIGGASLLTLQKIGEALGYCLVGCDVAGINAFFVRNDLVLDLFAAPFTAKNHYEPPRYFLRRVWGHPSVCVTVPAVPGCQA